MKAHERGRCEGGRTVGGKRGWLEVRRGGGEICEVGGTLGGEGETGRLERWRSMRETGR